jgi:hypothetical protein
VDVDRDFRGNRDVVISVPPSRRRHAPAVDRAPSSGASEVIGVDSAPDIASSDGADDRREYLIVPSAPVQPAAPAAPPVYVPTDRPVRGVIVRPDGRGNAARAPSGWARPVAPGQRADQPVRAAPTAPAGRWSTPARVAAPQPSAPPQAPNQATAPAANAGHQAGSHARPAPGPARSGPVRTIRVPRR